ncbi:uridine diphosphate glucose pyrophosphatase NUDT14-like isoform X3 [Crassostrea virginica]
MDNITDVFVEECTKSRYLKPLRLKYKQNGSGKIWDAMKVHDSIAVLLFNKSKETFVFVKQFRPGIIDKDISPAETAKMEIHEECGFDVPLESIEHVTSYRAGVGTTGSKQYLFYAEVTEEMRTGQGGGIVEEGEMIDVIEIPRSEVMTFVMDESINKPVGIMFAVLWYFQNKAN